MNTIHKERTEELLTFVYNYFSNNLPPVFDNYFDSFDHQYNTRNGSNTIRLKTHATQMAASSVTTRKNFRAKN